MKIKENIFNIFSLGFSKKEISEINLPHFNEEVYTSFEDAIKEIKRRREDKDLVKRVESYLKNIPEPLELNGEIRTVLFRDIASPQYEIKRFFDLSTGFKVKPLFWEYHRDKFHSGNFTKYTLGKLFLFQGMGKTGKSIFKKRLVIDFNSSNGKMFKDLKTINGENFIDFHHSLLEKFIPDSKEFLFDASDWLTLNGGTSSRYYKKYLALFLIHGILFENFLLDDAESKLTREVVYPAFLGIKERFGIKPLIVALNPTETEGAEFWNSYPHSLESML